MEFMRQSVIVFFISWLLCSIGAGGPSIYILDEAKNAQCAREMYDRGDFIVPTFNDKLRTDKPPLHYYFMKLGYAIGGVSNLWARIFSGFCGALTILIIFWLSLRYLNIKSAWWAAASLWAAIHFTIQFHLAVPDPYLVACMTAGMAFLFHHFNSRSVGYQYAGAAALGLAVLAKGPVGLLLPGLIFLIYLLIKRQNIIQYIWRGSTVISLLIFATIAVPWYVAVGEATDGAWLRGFFLDHNINRFSSPKEGHGGLFIITPIMVFLGMLPGSVFLVGGMRKLWPAIKKHDVLLFAAIAAGIVITFFSISETKLPNYPVPSYPFLGLLIGYVLSQISVSKISWWVLFIFALALPIGGYVGLRSLALFEDIAHVSWLWAVLPLGILIAIFYRNEIMAKRIALGSFILGGALFFLVIFPKIDQKNPVHGSADLLKDSPPLVAYRYLNPAFVFRYGAPIPVYQSVDDIKAFLKVHPDAIVISRKKHIGAVQKEINGSILFERKDLFENPVSVLFRPD